MNRIKQFIFWLIVLFHASPVQASESVYTDAHVKAIYIMNLPDFITHTSTSKKRTICTVGEDAISVSMHQKKMQSPHRYSDLNIITKAANSSFDSCHLVFISGKNEDQLNNILYKLDQRAILTVSNIKGFSRKGGMVELSTINKKVRLLINNNTIKKHGVKLSAKVIELADEVVE